MSGRIIAFFRASPPKAGGEFDERRFRSVRWQTFITMTLAYVTFYVCRLSFTVAKSALVELGITPTELGMIGSTLFFSYAIGKLVNGFIADHANVVRYMSLGLLLSAGMNLMMWLLGRTWGQTSDSLKLEGRFSAESVDRLRQLGHEVEVLADFSEAMGHAGAIVRHPNGLFEGASDPRSNGSAAGY